LDRTSAHRTLSPFPTRRSSDLAIREAGLGLNPQTEGQVIRVPIPDLNQERRRELTRVTAKYAEQARVSVRNIRRDGVELLRRREDRKSTRLNSSHVKISYAVFC